MCFIFFLISFNTNFEIPKGLIFELKSIFTLLKFIIEYMLPCEQELRLLEVSFAIKLKGVILLKLLGSSKISISQYEY